MDKKGHRYIGVCLSRMQEDLNTDFVHSMIGRAAECGFKVLIYNAFSDFYMNTSYDIGENHTFELIDYDILDGLIVMSETIKNDKLLYALIGRAREKNIFTVCVDKHVDGCYNISFNYKSAFEAITEHIISVHGCRLINLVAGFKNNSFSDERIECCRRVMRAHGVELDERRIMYGDFWSDPTARAFNEFMESGLSMPDAFICCNDTMAITICNKLKERGYSVPTDVIVTGFDGIVEERYHIPRLTTAKQDVVLAGIKAVDAIAAHLEGRDIGDSCTVDHKVMISHSCGCRQIDYRDASGQINPLFKLFEADNTYDTYMDELCNQASEVSGLEELSNVILDHTISYGYFYYALSLNENFANMSEDYDNIINGTASTADGKELILCESLFGKRFSPTHAEKLPHFEEAADTINIFLFWSVHFRDIVIGNGVMGLSDGSHGLACNLDIRHLLKHARNINHVLEIYNSQAVMKKVISRLNELYIRDHTGLYNRRGFYSETEKLLAEAVNDRSNSYSLVIISLDLDGLKTINDSYGHAEGDIAIKTIANAMTDAGGEHDICSRFGGDEFTVAKICTGDPEAEGNSMVERIKAYLDSFNSSSGKPYRVRGSYGVHWSEINGDIDIDAIIRAADDKMYSDKATHKESRSRLPSRK
ncbi:MAG: GGDEF domain-containing protein [Oscillospiraceae bacterium]|nr:GGDEF domain-containing protein [Oscillospiraceae bacterium]